MNISELIPGMVVFSMLVISLYIWWKHPKHIKTFKWIFLILCTILVFVGLVWAQGIPNGLLLGLLCAPAFLGLGYLRFFAREKIAKGLIDDIQAMLPEHKENPKDED